jgi:hypothetical protein
MPVHTWWTVINAQLIHNQSYWHPADEEAITVSNLCMQKEFSLSPIALLLILKIAGKIIRLMATNEIISQGYRLEHNNAK